MKNVTEIQQFLLGLTPPIDVGPEGADGRFGVGTFDAVNLYLQQKGRPPLVGRPTLVEVNAAMFPEEQVAPAIQPPSVFAQIGALMSIINLLKGKTRTSDQIAGIVRTVLAVGLTWLAGKGIIPAVPPDLLATLTLAVVGLWSWLSNRPKTITPIAK